jgi:Flp pilus assembly protein TadG
MRTNKGHRFWQKIDGQSLLEFALMLPVFLVIVLSIIDLGRLFGTYIALKNASREGARFASMYSTTTNVDAIKARAIAEASATGYPGLTPDDVDVIPSMNWQDGDPVTVRMTYRFQFLTTMILGSSSINATAQTTMVVVGGS